jgi:hypothetical protein
METFDKILSPVSPFIAIAGLIYIARSLAKDMDRKGNWARWLILPLVALWWFSATAVYRSPF